MEEATVAHSHELFQWVWRWFEPDGGPRYGGMNHDQWEGAMRADLQDLWDHTGYYQREGEDAT